MPIAGASERIPGKFYDNGGAVFNIKHPDFGAVGDGLTADTGAVQAAMAAFASLARGGRLIFPPGQYVLEEQITNPVDDLTIQLLPGAEIIATIASTSNGIFYSDGKSRFRLLGGTFSGAFPWAVFIAGGAGHRVRGTTISGGTVPSGGKCGGLYLQDCSGFRLIGNDISGCGEASLDAGADILCNNGATRVIDGTIADNRCTSTEVCANVHVFNPLRVKVRGNTASGARVFASSPGTGGYGILLYQTDGMADPLGDNSVVDNTVTDTEGTGIYNQDGVPSTTIAANRVIRPCQVQTELSLAVAGIVANGAEQVVTANRVQDSARSGIILAGSASGSHVTDNNVIDPVLDGIAIQGAITDVGIVANRVSGIGAGRLAIGHHNFVDHATRRIMILNNVMPDVTHAIFLGASDDASVARGNVSTGLTDLSYIASLNGTNSVVEGNVGNGISFPEGLSADRGDANRTLVSGVDYVQQRFATALTANRTVTLSSVNARNGARFRVIRTGLGAFTLNVGGLKTIPSATAAVVEVTHDGTAWRLTGYQTL